MLTRIGRVLIVIVAVLVIVLCLGGIVGAWTISNAATNITLKVFSVVDAGVEVVDTAVGRVGSLIQTARNEVQQASQTVTTIAGELQENHPVLAALSERLETRLGPTVDSIQEAAVPVHDALVTVSGAVSFANSIPFIQERAPRLNQLDQTLTQISALAADVRQLRTTLREAAAAQADRLTQGAATALTDLASRIDGGLATIQSGVQELQSEVAALQVRIQTLQSRLLLIYDLVALAATLLYAWVIYSQVVVIRHHGSRLRQAAPQPTSPGPDGGAAPAAPIAAEEAAPQTAEPPDAAAAAPLPAEAAPETGAQAGSGEVSDRAGS